MKIKPQKVLFFLLGIFGILLLLKTLKSISPIHGEDAYAFHCAKCHGNQGEGFGTLIPPLKDADWLNQNMDRLPCIVNNGLHEKILVNGVVYEEQMLGVENLTSVQVANICNYVAKEFTNTNRFYLEEEVKTLLSDCE